MLDSSSTDLPSWGDAHLAGASVKLALFTDRPHSNYGAELNLLAIADFAKELGHEVVAASIDPGVFIDRANGQGVKTLVIPTPVGLTKISGGGLRKTPATLLSLARFGRRIHHELRRHDVDVVMTSSTRAAVMLWPGRLRRPRLLWYMQMLTEPTAEAAAAGVVASHIATIATGVEHSIPAPIRQARRRRMRSLPPWREVEDFASPDRQPHQQGTLEVVTVGKVTPRKGVHLLVEAVALARGRGADVRLTVVGDPSGAVDERYAAAIEATAERLAVPVTWPGWQDDVAPYLTAANAFALVSDREGLPGAVVEAMAAGLPILVSDTGPVATLVESAACGHVVDAGDVRAVAEVLVEMAMDPVAAVQMGANAEIAAQAFSPEETKQAIGAILSDMAPRSARPDGARSW